MPVLIGTLLAFAVGLMGTLVGLDRDRSFYPTMTIVIASTYALFAVMGASMATLGAEMMAGALFLVAALLGFRYSLWLVVAALAGHGVMDLIHGNFIANPGVPAWWPAFCLTYDLMAAAYLAWLLRSGRLQATR